MATRNGFFKWMLIPALTFLFLIGIRISTATADNATILPKGVSQIFSENFFYLPITKQFDKDGNTVRIDAPFNTPLTAIVPGLPPGADLGTSVVTISLDNKATQITPAYGLTDRLSIGAIIPILNQTTNFTGTIDTSTANTGKSPALMTPGGIGAPCFVPGCATGGPLPGTTPLNLNDVNALLASLGYKPLKPWQGTSVGDIDVGGRYQYHRSERYRAAFTGGIRIPTGTVDDPDDLLDQPTGTGAWAFLLEFQQDALFSKRGTGQNIQNRLGFPTPGSYYLNTDIRAELYVPDKVTKRICPATAPICATKATVNRSLGTVIRANFAPVFGLFKGWIFTPEYRFRYKFKDNYSYDGPQTGVDVSILENDSYLESHEMKFILAFTTLPWVVEKKFPLPMVISATYRDRVAGKNTTDSEFFGFNVRVYLR